MSHLKLEQFTRQCSVTAMLAFPSDAVVVKEKQRREQERREKERKKKRKQKYLEEERLATAVKDS